MCMGAAMLGDGRATYEHQSKNETLISGSAESLWTLMRRKFRSAPDEGGAGGSFVMNRVATASILIARAARVRRLSRPSVRIFLSVGILSAGFGAGRSTLRSSANIAGGRNAAVDGSAGPLAIAANGERGRA